MPTGVVPDCVLNWPRVASHRCRRQAQSNSFFGGIAMPWQCICRSSGLTPSALSPTTAWVVRFGAPVALADGRTVVPMLVRDATTGFIVGVTLLPQRREDAMVAFVESLFVRHGVPWRVQVAVEPALLTMAPCRLHSVTTVWCMQVGVVVEFAAAEPRGVQAMRNNAWRPGSRRCRPISEWR